jgi:hypothetical protein
VSSCSSIMPGMPRQASFDQPRVCLPSYSPLKRHQCGSARAGGLGDRPSPCRQPGSSLADCQPLGLLPFRSDIRGRVRAPYLQRWTATDGAGRRGRVRSSLVTPALGPAPGPQTISNARQQGTPAVNELAARRRRPAGRRTSRDRPESSLKTPVGRRAAGRRGSAPGAAPQGSPPPLAAPWSTAS